MEEKLGAHIAALRKSKGMTQDQLAAVLGVSAPAVSKWETNSSCPDISLLCPLARALGTNVDTLLQFEETPSDEMITEYMNDIVETARMQEMEQAEIMLENLLHQYPSSIPLKYNAAVVLTAFEMMFPSDSEEKKSVWKRKRKELLEKVRENRASGYWQQAVSQLAAIAVADDELDHAEQLLNELPLHNTDPTMLWAQLYLKRGERDQALKAVQHRLYVLVSQAQSCLITMISEKMEPDSERALEICGIYRKLEELFGSGGGMSDGLFAEIYRRAGRKEDETESLIRFIDVITGKAQMPKPLLFSAALKTESDQMASTKEMRKMFLHSLTTEEYAELYNDNERFRAAVEKLRRSI